MLLLAAPHGPARLCSPAQLLRNRCRTERANGMFSRGSPKKLLRLLRALQSSFRNILQERLAFCEAEMQDLELHESSSPNASLPVASSSLISMLLYHNAQFTIYISELGL